MPKGTAKYEPSEAGWQKIAMSNTLRDACADVARVGQAYAVSISPESRTPVGRKPRRLRSVQYKDSFSVRTVTVKLPKDKIGRVAAELQNTAPHARIVEVGKKGQQGARVFAKTAAFLSGPK